MAERFQALDALRGVAALAVAIHHTNFVAGAPGAFFLNAPLGVDLFFMLSGFVLAHAYRTRILDGLPLRGFMAARVARLWPLHIAVLVAWVIAASGFQTAFPGQSLGPNLDLPGLAASAVLLNSVGLLPGHSWNFPSWSIGAEMMVYLVFFLALTGLGRRLTGGVALAAGVTGYALLAARDEGSLQATHDLGALRALAGFFCGVALHAALPALRRLTLGTGAEVVALAAVVAALGLAPGAIWHEVATLASFGGLLAVFAVSRGRVARLLETAVPQALGAWSYSIYLVHALVFTLTSYLAITLWPMETGVFAGGAEGPRGFVVTPWAPVINLGLLAVIVAISAWTFRRIERPGQFWLRRVLTPGAADPRTV